MKLKYTLSMALLAFASLFRPQREVVCNALSPREVVANTIREIESQTYEAPASGGFAHERVTEANASLFDQAYFNEPLTNYAVGFRDTEDVEKQLEFYAPMVPTPRRFSYAVWDNAEEFLSADDDERPIGSDFKNVEYISSKVEAKTANRGLQICLDLDELDGMPNWEEVYTQQLLRRIRRNSLRRAVNLISGTATNSPLTWSAVAGKDPDQDILLELITCADAAGVRPNRVGYGDTSWSKRLLAHRFQASAGGFGSASLTPEQLAGFLQVDDVQVTKARYTSSATARTQIVANLVLMFNAASGADTEDFSNIKRFVSMGSADQGGGPFQVYSQRVSAKRHILAVGHYELIKLTSTVGMRKGTIS
jgi:hypothetical protein